METNRPPVGCRQRIDAEPDQRAIAPLETHSHRLAGASPLRSLQAPKTHGQRFRRWRRAKSLQALCNDTYHANSRSSLRFLASQSGMTRLRSA